MNIETVNELIASLESAGDLSIREQKFLKLAKAFKQLAAENVALKKFCKNAAFDADYEAELGMEMGGFTDALNNIETPATDRIVAGIKAEALPANIAEIIDSGDLETICYESERSYAEDFRLAFYNFRQLREGADK